MDGMSNVKKREWCYVLQPKQFGMGPCDVCGNSELQWSEYEGRVWCETCQKDTVLKNNGVFDGPIAVNMCALFGIVFDRVILATQQVEIFDLKKLDWVPALSDTISDESQKLVNSNAANEV